MFALFFPHCSQPVTAHVRQKDTPFVWLSYVLAEHCLMSDDIASDNLDRTQ